MIQSEYFDYQMQEICLNLPKMNQVTTWCVPYGQVKIKFVEDDDLKILLTVPCSDGIVYILKTAPLEKAGNAIESLSTEKIP